jgi:uncharacterized secreted protein with C-terminal beta-propeller domain
MKAKLVILVIVAAVMVSFTFASQSKKQTEQHKSASSVNGRQLDDRGQFN